MTTTDASVLNPMVEYLTSLRTQQRGGNPSYVHENRTVFLRQLRERHPWFPADGELHIPSRLDQLVENLAGKSPVADVVFLTGDAGDGKTAACAALAEQLGLTDDLVPEAAVGGWVIIKDASELTASRLEQLLTDLHLQRTATSPRLIIAINEGRLRRLENKLYAGHPFREGILRAALDPELDAAGAETLDAAMRTQRTLVLNFRLRAHVRQAVPALLERWTRPEFWENSPTCSTCPAADRCPMLANARDLRAPTVQTTMGTLLLGAFFAGHRLPLRRLQASLALACTGGLDCELMQHAPDVPHESLRHRFYEVLFRGDADGGLVRVEPEALCRALSAVDPGPHAELTRDGDIELALGGGLSEEPHATVHGHLMAKLERDALRAVATIANQGLPGAETTTRTLVRSMRRWLALTCDAPSHDLERWMRLVRSLESYAAGTDAGDELRKSLVDGLNRLNRVPSAKTDSLTRRVIDAGGFRDPQRMAIELDLGADASVELRRLPVLPKIVGQWLETSASEILLDARPIGSLGLHARLPVDARLAYALGGVLEGYRHIGGLGPFRRDIARFVSVLTQLAVTAGHRPRLALVLGERRSRVTADGNKLNIQAVD